ncbi:MAG: hypothetical protein ABEH58_02775 [Haloplanus sp.]
MSLHTDLRSTLPDTSIAVEFGVLTATLVCLTLWTRLVGRTISAIVAPTVDGGLLATSLVSGLLSLAGLLLFAGAYVRLRDGNTGWRLPAADDLPTVVAAALTPLLLVAVTKLVGVATGVPYTDLMRTAIAADAPLEPILLVAGLALLVGVPPLVVICQLLVQGSVVRVVNGDAAVVLTALVAGFLLVSDTGGLATRPGRGRLAGVVAFAVLLGVAAFADARTDRTSLRYAAIAPVPAFAVLVVLSGVAGVDTLAGGLFTLAHLATLAVAAAAYERTDSLPVPAVAYASLLLANQVVVVLETGLGGW